MHRRVTPLNPDNRSLVRKQTAYYFISVPSSCNKIKTKKSVTYELCQPVIILGQVLGLISWDFMIGSSIPTGRNLFKRILLSLYKAIAKIGIILIFVSRLQNIFVYSLRLSTEKMLVLNAASWIPISYSCLVMVYYIFNAMGLHNLLSLLNKYEKVLEKGIKKRKFQLKNCIVQFVLSFVLWLYWLIYALKIQHVDLNYKASVVSFLFVQFCFDTFTAVSFVVNANLCAELFSLLNCELENNLPSEMPVKNQVVHHICIQYKQLYQLAECVQSEFSMLVTALLGSDAFILCMRSDQILTSNSFSVETVRYLLLVVVFIYRMFIVCAAADNITGKARLVAVTLNNIDPKFLSQTEFQSVVMLSNKLILHPVEITAAGNLFRINMSTFTTLMGTILTYLVVLTQFNSPDSTGGLNTNSTMINTTQ